MDHDPEAEHVAASDSDDSSDNENAGTEHYVDVGKSKLRQKGENSLGPQYRGSKVSRNALEQESSDEEDEGEDDDEEYDDPETADLEADTAEASDSEISSDDALGESDNEKLSKFVFRGSSNPKKPRTLVAANTFSALEEEQEEEEGTAESYDTAEATALSLLNTISSLRENCGAPVVSGTKRKRDYEASSTSAEIWEQLQEEDRCALKFRKKCLEKWSRKVQSVNVTAPKAFGSRNKTLVDSLHDQLNDPEKRLAKRTRVPRSCAPAQHAKKMAEDKAIFDDADFYQLLLKELVEQRTVDSSSNQTSAVPSVVLTATRENRTRKVVDRKASKGRKMRFTVHEKLQNFMAPEDRRQWEQSAIDRLFSTLFGRKLELNEDEADEDEDMIDVADANFKLFA
ncbi:Protein BFR2 [Beauveria bassiana]|uniref:Protein BFR2 n=1 Tax=Beauveria bassiana TaxID=176275 RepID=A0A2N6NB87_BEABA|nr:Protein BFR2 [Beauveria bassiana]